ncbi:hypothetical protein F5148DRAFT_1240697 [Russula earlei]|uniref:Uncharacterized protein n=1 Tax=Russula earlei TaxID=71964 RepID=A0ACC0TY20_9AGAM|nr:hypothetical protein F5148DRAFT_1240697 [Russula earlei]
MISMRTLSGFVIFILAVGNPPSLALPSTRAVLSTRGEPPGEVTHTTPNKHGSGDQTHLYDGVKKQPDRWLKERVAPSVREVSAEPAPEHTGDPHSEKKAVGQPRVPPETIWTQTTRMERMKARYQGADRRGGPAGDL